MNKKIILGVVAVISLAVLAYAAGVVEREAHLSNFSGQVMVKKARAKDWVAAKKDMVLGKDDTIKTDKDSYAEISFDKKNLTTVVMQAESDMVIGQITREPKTSTEVTYLSLGSGSVLTKVDKLKTEESEFKIKTPTAIVGVRGTGFEVKVSK